MSDDGEPHGTAGKPILTVLLHSEIGEIVAVVTRYFGGTKLGTGGLVRAYSGSVKKSTCRPVY
jgi:putative IMPACT (imprinted ancient) family translation regulator